MQSWGSLVLVLSAHELNLYQAKCSMLLHHNWISIPFRSLSKTDSHARKQGCTLPFHSCPSVCLLHMAGSAPKGHSAAQALTSEKSIPRGKPPNADRRWAQTLPGPLQSPALTLSGWHQEHLKPPVLLVSSQSHTSCAFAMPRCPCFLWMTCTRT